MLGWWTISGLRARRSRRPECAILRAAKTGHAASNGMGIAWMVADAFVVSLILLCGRGLGQAGAHPLQVIFLVNGVAALIAGTQTVCGARLARPQQLRLHLQRALLGIASTGCLLAALRSLSLYETTALTLLTPVFTFAAAFCVVRQLPAPGLVLAMAVVLCGVALLLSAQAVGGLRLTASAGVAFCAGVILFSVLNNLNQKNIGMRETMTAQMLWGPLFSLLLSFPFAVWYWQPLSLTGIALAGAYGVLLTVRMMTRYQAFRHGDVAVLMPFEYTRLLFATAWSVAFLGQRVTTVAAVGMALIGAGGAILVRRSLVQRRVLGA